MGFLVVSNDLVPIDDSSTFGQKAKAFMNMIALQREVIRLNSTIKDIKKDQAAERKQHRDQMQVALQMVQKLAAGDLGIDEIDLNNFMSG